MVRKLDFARDVCHQWSWQKQDFPPKSMISFEQIEMITKSAWKRKIKNVIKEKAYEYLVNQITDKNMTKLTNIKYSEFKLQEYFNCQKTSTKIKIFIFK